MRISLKLLPLMLPLVLCLLLFAQSKTEAQGDITPPVVMSLSVSPSVVDTRYSSQVVTVTAHITDDLSGLGSFAFWIGPQIIEHAQDKSLSFRDTDRIEGTPRDGIYINTVTLPQYSAEGRWVAKYSVIYDAVGNQSSCKVNGENVCSDDWNAFYFFNVQDSFFLYLPSLSRD